ncbi:hypothetical protein MSG28_013411 [Choristoneura fumiferana]|uniref:Uncharacterized protein n=1 Tax=Choristoneura fumiferana TaxID=7141 RepID=A0ACC0KTB7_CHOFU|nr:hypothetical protein MSG28_013411 [Choristoneura fumiferana]
MMSNFNGNQSEDQTSESKARTLHEPLLQTDGGVTRPWCGSWELGKLLQPAEVLRWGFVVIEPSLNIRADYARILSMIQNTGHLMGMPMEELVVKQAHVFMKDLKKFMTECKQGNVRLLFVVLPQSEKDSYHEVKQIAEQTVGIVTQCIREETALKGINTAIVKSLLMKANAKLMGVNHALHPASMPTCLQQSERVMVVGGHVIRQTPQQSSVYHSKVPAIAAITASIDSQYTKYNVEISIQEAKKEQIVDMENMMVEHLTVYLQHNDALPTTIIYFRNCMTNTQYNEVESYELGKFLTAYARVSQLQPGCSAATSPKILFLLVESPRNARFNPLDWDRSWDNLNRNLCPGYVITHHVDPTDCDRQIQFSMVSYNGTAKRRLSSYYVYYNNAVPKAELEKVTYYLCFLCGSTPRSVSCPTPLYYARLACRRGLSLTYGWSCCPTRLEFGPLRLYINKSLLEYGRMFFI